MSPPSNLRYFPAVYLAQVRTKAGEKKAIKNVDKSFASDFVPVWLVRPDDVDSDFSKELPKVWSGEAILDISRLPIHLVNQAASNIASATLPTRIGFMAFPDQISQIAGSTWRQLRDRTALRIGTYNAQNAAYHSQMAQWIRANIPNPEEKLLLFDHFDVTNEHYADSNEIASTISIYVSAGLSNIGFGAGAFPESISYIGAGTDYIERADKVLWEKVRAHLSLDMHYSDYGTVSPKWSEGRGTPYSNIRFTDGDSWFVLRDNARGKESAIALAELLLSSPDYSAYDSSFSWGDEQWDYKVTNDDKPGGPTEHVAESMSHHIAHVLKHG